MKKAAIGVALIAGLTLTTTTPAQAVTYGSIKICASSASFTGIGVKRDGTAIDYLPNVGDPYGCTGYLYPVGITVDTDPTGESHSYKLKPIGTGASGDYGPCHENSDNHASNPPQSSSGYNWVIWYRNFDDGDCTN